MPRRRHRWKKVDVSKVGHPRLLDNMVTTEEIRRNYQIATSERRRVPNHQIPPMIRSDLKEWVVMAPMRWTMHLSERLKTYRGKVSRCGSYVELNESEASVLMHRVHAQAWLNERLGAPHQFDIVELGLNHENRICKVGLVLNSPDPTNRDVQDGAFQQTTNRVMFVCVGMDRGVKTAYITPGYKGRAQYKSRDGIDSVEDVQWISV